MEIKANNYIPTLHVTKLMTILTIMTKSALSTGTDNCRKCHLVHSDFKTSIIVKCKYEKNMYIRINYSDFNQIFSLPFYHHSYSNLPIFIPPFAS